MQAVGRIGSYISRSVYTVSGPFHPFGGAVDIIVVEQPDGTYKSSPWYVRFGKFQGVLKTKEKVVSISVNGVEADFHMYLNHKGEAYFLKEIDEEDDDSAYSPPSSSGEDTEKVTTNRKPLKSISCNCDSKWSENEKNAVARSNSGPSQIFGLVFGRKSKNDENEPGVVRTESLEHAEIAADLLDLKWSTNLVSPKRKKDNNNNASQFSAADKSKDEVNGNLEVDGENGVKMKCVTEKVIVETATSVESVREITTFSNSETDETGLTKSEFHVTSASVISEDAKSDAQTQDCVEKLKGDQFTLIHEERVSVSGSASESIVTEYSQLVSIHQSDNSVKDIDSQRPVMASNLGYVEEIYDNQESRISVEEQLLFGNLDDFALADHEEEKAVSTFSSRDADGVNVSSDAKCSSGFSLDQSVLDNYMNDVDPQRRRLRSISSESCINKTGDEDLTRVVRSLPSMGPLSNNLEASDKPKSPGARTTSEDVQIPEESKEAHENPSTGIPPRPIGSQRSWPFSFQRSRSMKASRAETSGIDNSNTTDVLNNSSDLEGTKDATKEKENKKTLRTLTPTSEQLSSLNLKEGKNVVVFTFQTAMLGKQQVDARIFMWRWDTRIVISDVDGTITRSDLLGQVMPLVGMDWSQTGVAHLFSAIKENGYQLLFLSARSIAQSFITRQFLFNIKQDGKALPEGPVVISPDGLFPSLFREVVRRAPHEFKIACLEDIKALFPADTNPFYAGFGNRDTDEFSYLKVGIPRGKIFIINPKGEIAVNRRVDTKSYLSLHALVHGMFPTMSSSEQEDFNSWNYWKLPPPIIDL